MLKWALIVLGGLALLVLGGLLALPYLLDTPAIQTQVAFAAAHAVGRPVKFTSLSFSALPLPTVHLRGLEIADDPAFGRGPFLTVTDGKIGVKLWPLFSGRVEVADIALEEPRVELIEDQAGRWNVASLGGPTGAGASGGAKGGAGKPGSTGGAMLLAHVRVKNGALHYQKRGAKGSDLHLEKINLAVSQAGLGETLHLRGDAVAEPGAVRLVISDATLRPSGARSLFDAPVKASVEVEAREVARLAELFVASPALSGPMKGRLQVSGPAGRPSATGQVRFDQLTVAEDRPQCPAPRRRQLRLDDLQIPVGYTPVGFESRTLQAKVSRGRASMNVTTTLGRPMQVTLKDINVKGMELGPVLVDYLCQGTAVTGPLDLTGELGMRAEDPWRTMSGSGRLRVGPGRVVGQDLLRAVTEVLAMVDVVSAATRGRIRQPASALDFDSITATYTIVSGVLRTDDLLYQTKDLRIAAAGTYGLADGRVAMDVTLTQGKTQVRGRVSGGAGRPLSRVNR
ncbi:MAG TPA: AsmA-like C-terminal region-containing protein, partial [Methylomirabilota bacterium]|nr:AsmA-like C-terminal region-containing protein [Methylomirabilota bacterium]